MAFYVALGGDRWRATAPLE